MAEAPAVVTVPVLCPADGCWTIIDCPIQVSFTAAGLGGAIRMDDPAETWLADVAAHMMVAHPELCEPAPVEP